VLVAGVVTTIAFGTERRGRGEKERRERRKKARTD
jgi:hypothetical protein